MQFKSQREATWAVIKAFGGRIKAAIQVHCNWQNACGTLFAIGIGRMLWKWPSASEFFEIFNREILPAASRLVALSQGSVCFTVKAETSLALAELYERYRTGRLQRDLQEFLVTDDIRQLADGEEVIIRVHVDEKEFQEARNDLENVDKEGPSKDLEDATAAVPSPPIRKITRRAAAGEDPSPPIRKITPRAAAVKVTSPPIRKSKRRAAAGEDPSPPIRKITPRAAAVKVTSPPIRKSKRRGRKKI
ncbi:uncharacterized protein [Acropora muricata]|uniref:uncharacterized protein isoform X2 n=1 Tax=Acropora muricata TaxID=159855 RepID=UPI0034E50B78